MILQANLVADGELVVDIIDHGVGIADVEQAMQPLFTSFLCPDKKLLLPHMLFPATSVPYCCLKDWFCSSSLSFGKTFPHMYTSSFSWGTLHI